MQGKMADGGERINYDGGAMREPSTNKGAYELVSPFAEERIAVWYELGARKYADRNWEKGIPFGRLIQSAKRHLNKWCQGKRDEDHLAAVCWNVMAMMHFEETGQAEEWNNYPAYRKAAPCEAGKPALSPIGCAIIAEDFDGCLCANAWPEIGAPNEAEIAYLKKRKAEGAKLILWTCREGDMLLRALQWCAERGLTFDAANQNLPEMNAHYGNDSRKIGATEYRDDKAVNVKA